MCPPTSDILKFVQNSPVDQYDLHQQLVKMTGQLFTLFSLMFTLSSSASVQKYVNSCGIIYTTGTQSHGRVKSVLEEMAPRISELLHMLKASHHKLIEDYGFKRTWIPDENNVILTKSPVNIAKQLPSIYKSLLTFSYALDFVYEDNITHEKNEMCFFFIDTLPAIIDKHRELVCTTNAAMGKLNMEVPDIDIINLPNDWAQPQGTSCVDKFFRFSETHSKYRKFLSILLNLLQI